MKTIDLNQEEVRVLINALNEYDFGIIKECAYQGEIDEKIRAEVRIKLNKIRK
jgi:hypothetical protein